MSYFKPATFYGLLAAVCCQGAYSADLKTEIKNLSPYAYWTLQNTFSSEIPAAVPISLTPWEQAGANAMLQGAGFYNPDYFPVTPLHLSPVPENNGLWLGETTGDLKTAKRYLGLTAAIAGKQPAAAFNMDTKNEWTLHLLVSPDPDPLSQRAAEVVYYAGNTGSNVQLIVDATNTGTTIKAQREGQGNINGPQIIIPEAQPGVRHWYHVIVRYGLRPDTSLVTDITLDVAGSSVVGQSNQWLIEQSNSPIIIGKGNSQEYFNGAIQHLALWKRKLSDSEVATLKTSLTVAPAATAPLTVDSSQVPRYFMWTVPTRENSLSGRDGLNWRDPIWQIPGVYPMVRHKMDFPTAIDQNAPGTSAQLGEGPKDTAKQSYEWIKYINGKLYQYSGKSLSDGVGYSLFMQNWGRPALSGGSYSDPGAARGLMKNWRDAPTPWRNRTHATTIVLQEQAEISNPFYREGMSQNIFRTTAMFKELNRLLDSDPSLQKPSRLHFDIESNIGVGGIGEYFPTSFAGCVDNDSQPGWFCASLLDSRAQNFDSWGIKSYWGRSDSSLSPCLSLSATLDSNGEALPSYWDTTMRTPAALLSVYKPKGQGVWQAANTCFQEEFTRFGNANYEYAINQALKKPAQQMLNSNIRVSEYSLAAAGRGSALFSTARDAPLLGDGGPRSLDFSSPVLYPLGGDAIDADPSLKNWESRLTPGYSFFSSQISNPASASEADVKEAIDNLYVETQKHNLNIAVKAAQPCAAIVQAPWLPYPGYATTIQKSGVPIYSNMPSYKVKWQELARLSVFAYRRGVREFLMWGDDSLVSGPGSEANLLGLEKVYAAVNFAKANAFDFTTTGATSRSNDNFGVPDGVVDASDYAYYIARYNDKDSEADLVAEDGQCAQPDGKVTSRDLAAFSAQISSQYFSYREGIDGGNLTSIAQINSFINNRTPDAKFLAKKFAYGSDYAFENNLGHASNLQSFLGTDAASLSADPGESSDAILRMFAAVELPAGNYDLLVRGDDGYQIKVDGVQVALTDTVQPPTETGYTFNLSSGGIHLVEILYWDQGYQAVFKAKIRSSGSGSYSILRAYQ